MMQQVWKKGISLLLAVAMLCTLIGGSALAAGEDKGETPPASANAAKIGDTEYKTLREAITAAATGDTITLLKDCEGTVQISMNSKKKTPTALTLDLNGYAIDGKGEKRCILGIQADSRTDRCALTVKNGTLRNGAANGSSGGAISWPCDLTIEKCTIENNKNKAVAVSFQDENGKFIARDTKFCNNEETRASHSGGAISIAQNGTAELTRCSFESNTAASMGGAVYCDHGTLQVTDCTFQQNSAASGGAVAGMELALTLEHSEAGITLLQGNKASSTGGAIHMQTNSTLQVMGVEFRDNKASFGGAVYTYDTEANISGTLEANKADTDGGGLYGYNSTVTATGNFFNNIADRNGGGICIQGKRSAQDSKTLLKDCRITGNVATGSGGGLYATNGANIRMQGGSLVENSAEIGGGVYLDGSADAAKRVQADLAKAVIYNNCADTAGDDLFAGNCGKEDSAVQLPGIGSRWKLMECSEKIDAWYEDGMPETTVGDNGVVGVQYGARWNAHSQTGYVQPYAASEEHSSFALKAAHKVVVPMEPDDPTAPLEISKSKTATNLDKNYESDVTLTLPSAVQHPSIDVALVMDVSSSMKEADIREAKAAATALCDQLAEKQNLDIRVGIVTFDQTAHALTDGLVAVADAKAAVDNVQASSDTNMMAGLMAGKAMLDQGSGAEKYLIVMSDGIPIYWMENGEATSKTLEKYQGGSLVGTTPAGSEPEGSWEYDTEKILSVDALLAFQDWDADSNVWKQDMNTGADLNSDCKYTNIQKATYQTAKYLLEEIFGKYNLKMVAFGTDKYQNNVVYKCGENFCDWIGAQNGVDYYKLSKPEYGGETGDLCNAFGEIADSLLYLVDAGSRIEDYMGYVEEDYDFAFVNDVEKLELTVGGVALDKVALDENTYGFGTREALLSTTGRVETAEGNNEAYRFVLHYVPEEKDGEHFVLFINEAVTKEAPVQLTYTVKLMHPKSSRGSYGQFDADGSQHYDGLYTNNSATLYPVDSEGLVGVPENFRKPTVSYTIRGGGGGHHETPPDLETKQHFGYIIGREDGLVHPEAEITRAEATTIFFRLLKEESRKANWGDTAPFSDVSSADWYNHATATLHKLGVVSGYPDGSFSPDASITRAEFVKLATGFFQYQYTGSESFFNDISDSWAADAIRAAASMGLIDGYPDGSFRPNAPISRAEAVAIVNRTLGRTPEGNALATRTDMIVWPDNRDTSAWYYADIQEATNSHDYTRVDQQSGETWTGMQKMRDWAALEREWADSNTSPNPGDVA